MYLADRDPEENENDDSVYDPTEEILEDDEIVRKPADGSGIGEDDFPV